MYRHHFECPEQGFWGKNCHNVSPGKPCIKDKITFSKRGHCDVSNFSTSDEGFKMKVEEC